MNKKGFTLVELLAVIVILGVIGTITAPIVINLIDDSRQSAFKSSLNGIKKAIENDYSDNGFDTTVKYYYGGYENGNTTASNSNKKLRVYDKNGNHLRYVEVSGQIIGKGRGSVTTSGTISVGIFTDQFCGIVKGNDISVFVIGKDISKSECITEINKI